MKVRWQILTGHSYCIKTTFIELDPFINLQKLLIFLSINGSVTLSLLIFFDLSVK